MEIGMTKFTKPYLVSVVFAVKVTSLRALSKIPDIYIWKIVVHLKCVTSTCKTINGTCEACFRNPIKRT